MDISLHENVKILAAMNPSSKYGSDFDYQVVDMDAAQENRFVWFNMESDYNQWIKLGNGSRYRAKGYRVYIILSQNIYIK